VGVSSSAFPQLSTTGGVQSGSTKILLLKSAQKRTQQDYKWHLPQEEKRMLTFPPWRRCFSANLEGTFQEACSFTLEREILSKTSAQANNNPRDNPTYIETTKRSANNK